MKFWPNSKKLGFSYDRLVCGFGPLWPPDIPGSKNTQFVNFEPLLWVSNPKKSFGENYWSSPLFSKSQLTQMSIKVLISTIMVLFKSCLIQRFSMVSKFQLILECIFCNYSNIDQTSWIFCYVMQRRNIFVLFVLVFMFHYFLVKLFDFQLHSITKK